MSIYCETVTANQGAAGSTPWPVKFGPALVSTISTVDSDVASHTILAANANRRGAIVVNKSTATLFLAYDGSATVDRYTVKIAPGGQWEMGALYGGVIGGCWSADDTGQAVITELT